MENAVMIHPADSVVTVTKLVPKGDPVQYSATEAIVAVQDIPVYHKIAIFDITKGNPVYKYGEQIGVASVDIHVGEHVHVHNLKSVRA
jgi:altronate dehydratase small subunit